MHSTSVSPWGECTWSWSHCLNYKIKSFGIVTETANTVSVQIWDLNFGRFGVSLKIVTLVLLFSAPRTHTKYFRIINVQEIIFERWTKVFSISWGEVYYVLNSISELCKIHFAVQFWKCTFEPASKLMTQAVMIGGVGKQILFNMTNENMLFLYQDRHSK